MGNARDKSELRESLVDLMNDLIDRRLSRREIECCGLLSLPDGNLINSDKATDEQWAAARTSLETDTLVKATDLIDDLITLMVSQSVFTSRRRNGEI